jgi:hypothetical protein
MAEFTPVVPAAAKPPSKPVQRVIYAYDPYNFSHVTTTSGTNIQVIVPATGPHAAGAPPPRDTRTVVEIISLGTTARVEYGNNFGTPGA